MELEVHTKTSKLWISLRRIFLTLFLILLLGLIGAGFAGYKYIQTNLTPISIDSGAAPASLHIPAGATTTDIANILANVKLIRDPNFFVLYSRYMKFDGSYRRGAYIISPTLSIDEIMAVLRKGPLPVRVTIPEGFTTKQIIDRLVENGLIDRSKFEGLVRSYDFKYDFLVAIPAGDNRLEGFLFPDTYDVEKGLSEEKIIRMMLERFSKELTPEIRQFVAKKGWSVRQYVTMASLIEKEAVKDEDRPLISQVFQKRLQIDMPLQSCASIEYLLGYTKPVLSYQDLAIKSPYNTYLNKGLPPGPLGNPGHASLLAAAQPSATEYLYFVAKPDGYHAFAKTLLEHDRNVKKYQG